MEKKNYRIILISTILLFVSCFIGSAQVNSDTVRTLSTTKLDHGITWILVEGGEMGNFYISSTEVTFDQYDEFCHSTGYQKPEDKFGRGKQPVVFVNVADMVAYCTWLSKETGKTVRMPTKEEYEYAADGGNKNDNNIFSGSSNPDEVAWYVENSDEKNHEVATKKPNELGIYDMSGNVWECCPTSNVLCGGSSLSDVHDCFSNRTVEMDDHNARSAIVGFRVVMK